MEPEEARLEYAVRLAARSDAVEEPDSGRLDAGFRRAYGCVEGLAPGGDPWTIRLLEAAWDLARAAHPNGTPLERLLDTFETGFRSASSAAAPRPPLRRKPRRDA